VDVRKVVPGRILSVRILPLSDRTVVVAGNAHGHVGFWDVDRLVEEDEDGDGVDGVFEYFPHRGSVGGIVMHPGTPQKVIVSSFGTCDNVKITIYFVISISVYVDPTLLHLSEQLVLWLYKFVLVGASKLCGNLDCLR
jgi:hypothetical protein